MAKIDPKKFIPQNKQENKGLSSQRVSVSSGVSSGSTPNINPSSINPEGNENRSPKTLLSEVIEIRKNLLSILKLIRKDSSLLKKSEERKRKEREQQKFQEKELKSEERKNKLIPDFKSTEFPRMGFLDRIKQFLFYTVLGAAFTKFGKHIPKVLGLLKNLAPAFKTFEVITGNILNGFVDFIEFGYKAYDKVKEIIVGISGDSTEKRLKEFDKQFNTFANLAIIAGMTAAGSVDFDGGGKRERLGIDKQTGQKVSKRAQARYLNQYGQDAYIKKFGKRSFKGLTGKAPSRFAGRIAGKALGKVPIIGGLVDFIISTVIFKEKPGRAAAKAVGASVGSALGSVIAPFAGTILGGFLGDIVGGALYDSLVGGDKIQGKARGGQVTRGGKSVSAPIRRTVKRTRTKPTRIKPQRTIPGKDVGGREEIKKLFPSPKDPRQKNPLGVLETTSKNYKERVPLIGGIMGAALDSAMGQRPDPNTFKRIGTGFGYLIQNAIDAETNGTIASVQNQIVGLAGGGVVPRTLSSNENIGMKIGERIGKTLEAMVNSQVNNTLQSIRQQFTKQDIMDFGGGAPDNGGYDGSGDGSVFDGDYKEILDLIASVEGGYDSLNVGGAGGGTIAYGSSTATKKFGKPFSQMTVGEVMELQKQGKIHATGRYQIIKTTLEGLMSGKYGNTGVRKTDFYNAETQDRLGIALVNYRLKTGANVRNFRQEWIGLRKIDDQTLQNAIDRAKGGNIGIIRLKGLPPTGTLPGQQYGDPREGGKRRHAGVDFDAGLNDTFYSRIGGEVIYAANAGGGYGNMVDIYNRKLNVTERIAEGTQNLVKVGQTVKPGTPVQRGTHQTGVFHYEIRRGKATGSGDFSGTINPLNFLNSLQKKTQSPNIAKPDNRPVSPPPTTERTKITRPSWDPSKSGLKKGEDGVWKKASLVPTSTPKIASGLNQQTSYGDSDRTLIAIQPIETIRSVPTQTVSGSVNNISGTQSINQTQASMAIG